MRINQLLGSQPLNYHHGFRRTWSTRSWPQRALLLLQLSNLVLHFMAFRSNENTTGDDETIHSACLMDTSKVCRFNYDIHIATVTLTRTYIDYCMQNHIPSSIHILGVPILCTSETGFESLESLLSCGIFADGCRSIFSVWAKTHNIPRSCSRYLGHCWYRHGQQSHCDKASRRRRRESICRKG